MWHRALSKKKRFTVISLLQRSMQACSSHTVIGLSTYSEIDDGLWQRFFAYKIGPRIASEFAIVQHATTRYPLSALKGGGFERLLVDQTPLSVRHPCQQHPQSHCQQSCPSLLPTVLILFCIQSSSMSSCPRSFPRKAQADR